MAKTKLHLIPSEFGRGQSGYSLFIPSDDRPAVTIEAVKKPDGTYRFRTEISEWFEEDILQAIAKAEQKKTTTQVSDSGIIRKG